MVVVVVVVVLAMVLVVVLVMVVLAMVLVVVGVSQRETKRERVDRVFVSRSPTFPKWEFWVGGRSCAFCLSLCFDCLFLFLCLLNCWSTQTQDKPSEGGSKQTSACDTSLSSTRLLPNAAASCFVWRRPLPQVHIHIHQLHRAKTISG